MPMKEITFKRWEIVVAFIAITCAFVYMGVTLTNQGNDLKDVQARTARQTKINAHHIMELRAEKASIIQLERTDCKVRDFLLQSAAFRKRQAQLDTNPATAKKDMAAAKASLSLARSFTNELCPNMK